MEIRKLSGRKKNIKKPNWFLSFLCVLTVCAVIGFIAWNETVNPLVDLFWKSGYEQPNAYLREISLMAYDGLTEEDYDVISNFDFRQAILNAPIIITIDDQEVCNSSYAIAATIFDTSDIDAPDKRFLIHWDPETDPNAQKMYDYHSKSELITTYTFNVKDYYVDFYTNTLYLGKVEVIKGYNLPYVMAGSINNNIQFTGLFFEPIKTEVIDELDLTPSDPSLLGGLTHVDNPDFYDENSPEGLRLTLNAITGPTSDGNTTDEEEYKLGNEYHKVHTESNNSYINNYRNKFAELYALSIAVLVVIIALIVNTIIYLRRKSVYNIFEYRKKTTNAMAHDLKTPLAIASLSVANLKENLNKDNERVEYHANEIDESVQYINQLIGNILEFSNSESGTHKLAKVKLDVKKEIEAYKKEIKSALDERKMTLEITGDSTRITDKKLWNQAISNLIDNAVKYGAEGSTISVVLNEKDLTISNPVEKDIPNASSLIEPFVKGDNSRGENSGSGLGLAIADNNLSTLGYKLKIICKNNVFKAVIR